MSQPSQAFADFLRAASASPDCGHLFDISQTALVFAEQESVENLRFPHALLRDPEQLERTFERLLRWYPALAAQWAIDGPGSNVLATQWLASHAVNTPAEWSGFAYVLFGSTPGGADGESRA